MSLWPIGALGHVSLFGTAHPDALQVTSLSLSPTGHVTADLYLIARPVQLLVPPYALVRRIDFFTNFVDFALTRVD
eukprot:2986672-Rhodomonas_salina.1